MKLPDENVMELKSKKCKDGHLLLETYHGMEIEVVTSYSGLLLRLFKKGEKKQIGTGFWHIPYNGGEPRKWPCEMDTRCNRCSKEMKVR